VNIKKVIDMSLENIIYSILYYYRTALIPFGILSNFISLLIFIRPNLNKKTNTGFLYSILCVLNMIAIAEDTFVYRPKFFNYVVELPCNLEVFIRKCLLDSLPWIQVLICFDRFLATNFPGKAKIMSKKVII
jgi:hypothetical protein